MLSKVSYEGGGCECKAEYMGQGQFCPICRLMVQVWEYTKNIFKDTAQGRMPSSGFMRS